MRFQQKDKSLMENPKEMLNDNFIKLFCWVGKTLDTGKTVILKQIQKPLVEWHHTILCHPGKITTKLTIGQRFYRKGLQKIVRFIFSKWHAFQFLNHRIINYSKFPPKQGETQP